MSKPTMQDIADALSVSRITVWKALSNRPGVSDSMRAQIHQKATEMGYFHTPSQDTTATVSAQLPPHTRTVAVAVCRPESSLSGCRLSIRLPKIFPSIMSTSCTHIFPQITKRAMCCRSL
ncbi:MAG: LacI family DNA-binding transcriptional regulator [Ruminococcus callidus]